VETTTNSNPEIRRQARRGLGIYFAFLVPLSAMIETIIITSSPDSGALALVMVLMFVPAIASVAARLILREGFADVSFRFGGLKGWMAIGMALLFPVVIGVVAYGIAWTTGLARFDTSADLGIGLLMEVIIGTVLTLPLAAGEELGWRGFMLTRLIDSGVGRPVFMSGLIWGAWHVPIVLAGVTAAGPSPLLAVALFVVSVTSISYVIGRMRLETGSIWPAVVLHAAWDTVILSAFDKATTGADATLWVGESGILVALVLVAAAVILSRGEWAIIRALPAPEQSPAKRNDVYAQTRLS
jgi:membrane protease YdiL (CAAX protease family)